MKSKAKFWLFLWMISMAIATVISTLCQANYTLQTGTPAPNSPLYSDPTSPLANLQLILILFCIPFIILPLLLRAVYCATKENNKPIRIFGTVMIIHHAIAIILTLIQWIAH